MARRKPELTKSSIASIRANQANSASALLTRLGKSAAGTLKDKDDKPISMDSNQVKAAQIVISTVLPAQASTEVADITETVDISATREEVHKLRERLIQSLTPEEIATIQARDTPSH